MQRKMKPPQEKRQEQNRQGRPPQKKKQESLEKRPQEKEQGQKSAEKRPEEKEPEQNKRQPEVKDQPENGAQEDLSGGAEETERKHQEIMEKIQEFRPMDDDFLRAMLRDDLPLAQMMFRIIMKKDDLMLTSFHTQEDMKQIAGARSICLDAYAVDGQKRRYDLEIQRADDGANPHRARYHSSVLDVENLKPGQDFKNLPDTYVIFITEKDFFHGGKPLYVVDRMNRTERKPFGDGAHIIYVNGEYRGDDALGKLMHDFNCKRADEMHYDLMAEQTRYLKETKEGRAAMCKIMEDLCVESREEGLRVGREEGISIGRAEGLSTGRAEGLSIGRAEGLSAGRAEGLSAGREEGTITVLHNLVREGSLTKEKAASNAGMSVDEFERKVKELDLRT